MNYCIAFLGIVVLLISKWQFKKAAGDLSIGKLNIISFAFYDLLIFTCIGSMLILLGFRNHYMVEKIENPKIVYKTCLYLGYAMIMLPMAIRLFSKILLRGNIALRYWCFLHKKVEYETTEETALYLAAIATLIGLFSTIYMFYKLGGIPLLSLFKSRDLAGRIRISATNEYAGNKYFRNIVVLLITPLLSYFCYIYMRKSRTKKWLWTGLFLINAVLAILIKTYNLEKAPVIYWLFYFYIIEIMLGNSKTAQIFKRLLLLSVIVISGMYLISGYEGGFFSLSTGPLSRIVMTQSSTLFLHVQVFPQYHPFLNGASLPSAVSWLFGAEESWVRSGRVIMEKFNPNGVAAGEAGVMNAMFVGEAYANWGHWGVLFSPFIVALPFVITYGILLHQRKTPLTMVLYIALFMTFTNALQGGIVDYIYNTNFLLLLLLVFLLKTFVHKGEFVM